MALQGAETKVERFSFEENVDDFPTDKKVLDFRKLYNLSVTTEVQIEYQKFAREILKTAADVKLFKQYKLAVSNHKKIAADRKAASDTKLEASDAKLQQLRDTRKVLEDEIKGHQDTITQQEAIIADARRQQDALAVQFSRQMDLGKQAAPAASSGPTSSSSAANKKSL